MLELGKLIDGRYRLVRVAGEGAFGVVYEAHHIALDTRVAIKVLRALEAGDEPAAVGRFLSEARTVSRLRHPGIVRSLDAGVIDGRPYFVMEWCDGPTLKTVIAERGPMTAAAAWALLEPVFEAIAFAHRQGVVHRDLKPSNVVMFDGAARVIDFGIAKRVGEGELAGAGDTATTGRRAFTPQYASPEQLAGARTGPWTDVYALALVFVEVIVGSAKFTEETHLLAPESTTVTPKAFGKDVGPLEPVLARALALRPAERFADAGAFANAVREALAPRRRRRWILLAIPVLAAAALAFAFARPRVTADPGVAEASSAATVGDEVGRVPETLASVTPTASSQPVASIAVSASATVREVATGSALAQKPSLAKIADASDSSRPAFEVNGYQNGGFIASGTVQAVSRVAQTTKSCFPEPTGDDVWNVYIDFRWPKGKPRESRIEVRRLKEKVVVDFGNGRRTGGPNATAEQIATCVRAKFDGASIPDADGQDDLDGSPSYDWIDMGYFRN